MFFKNSKFYAVLIFALFVVLRLPGLDLPYHQDEVKWAGHASSGFQAIVQIPHPPLGTILMVMAAKIFGFDGMRYLPFVFGAINFWLLFYLVKYKFSFKASLWSVLFLSVAFYSVLASLMVDTDGQILPFFFLLSAILFYKWQDGRTIGRKIFWGGLLILSLLLGFLIKVSFIIAVGAIILELLCYKSESLSFKGFIKTASVTIGILVLFATFVFGILYFLPNFNISQKLNYWRHFIIFADRNYLQISIQFFKALFYASPLLLAPLFFINRTNFKKIRLFIIFLVLGLIFYLVLFDFSSGALDRYLQFMVVPLSIIGGVMVADIFGSDPIRVSRKIFVLSGLVAVGIFLTQFLPHFVPALYPKAEWFGRVLNLKWNFLFPFTGGSGPMGFYVSWLFMALTWLATIILVIFAFIKIRWRRSTWIVILILGLLYNGVFIEEYLFGKINGSPVVLLKNAVDFIKNDGNIRKVITYNSIGDRELAQTGKYERRLYVAPKFEPSYVDILKNFKGHYLVIEIPRIDSNSIYVRYFTSCKVVYEEFSGKIPARVYD
ncbi:MAG: glycosyltransferase family 39 protein, partial [Candidatus Buchananbacteria bacterium]|nr:glycosyltransferase family 39 protein [Candidatus Buchananbacteria bacterium]